MHFKSAGQVKYYFRNFYLNFLIFIIQAKKQK